MIETLLASAAWKWLRENWRGAATVFILCAALGALGWLWQDWRHRGELLDAERAARAGAEATASQWQTVAKQQAAEIEKLGEATDDYQELLDDALSVVGQIRTEYVRVPVEVSAAVREAPDAESAVLDVGKILAQMAREGGAP